MQLVETEGQLIDAVTRNSSYGADIRLAPNEYTFENNVTVTRNVPMRIDLTGCKINVAPGTTAFTISQLPGSGCKGVNLEGGWLDGGNKNNNTGAVKFSRTDRSSWRNFRFERFTTAAQWWNEGSTNFWTESCKLEYGTIQWCGSCIRFEIDSAPHPSFMQTKLRDLDLIGNDTGIYVGAGAALTRSVFDGVTMWVPSNGTGLYLDGRLPGSQWGLAFEHSAPASGNVAIDVGPNFLTKDFSTDPDWAYVLRRTWVGNWDAVVQDPDNKLVIA